MREWYLEHRGKFHGDRGNPVVNGFHQNRLESIQGTNRDELCLPRTDKYKYGGRPLFTSDNSLCESLASYASKKLKELRPVPLLPSRSEKSRVQRKGDRKIGGTVPLQKDMEWGGRTVPHSPALQSWGEQQTALCRAGTPSPPKPLLC